MTCANAGPRKDAAEGHWRCAVARRHYRKVPRTSSFRLGVIRPLRYGMEHI